MAKKIWVKDAGGWQLVTDLKVHDGTQFRNVTAAYVRASGAWKQVYLDKRTLTITTETAAYDVAAQLGNPSYAVEVDLTINTDVIVGSTLTTTPAIDCSGLVAGSIVNIFNNGTIVGMGGAGGNGGGVVVPASGYGCLYMTSVTNGANGGDGGHALKVGSGVIANITNASGYIYGGGGGGGGAGGGGSGVTGGYSAYSTGGGGGGGAGYAASAAGAAGSISGTATIRCNTSAALSKGAVHCPGLAGATGQTAGGVGGADRGWSYSTGGSTWAYRSKNGTAGNGGGYGEAGAAGTAGAYGWNSGGGLADCPNSPTTAGGTGGAAGKAIDLAGGTVNWISGNDSTHVKGAVA